MNQPSTTVRGPRLPAEEMRRRVLAGVLRVIATRGVEGLTHRMVAEAAGVSLSTTTYYFATLEDMLVAAMRAEMDLDVAAVRERFAVATPREIPELLIGYVVNALRSDTESATVFAELYVAALRRDSLRDLVDEWERLWDELLQPLVGDAAQAVSAAIGGIVTRGLVLQDRRAPELAAADLRALLAPLLQTE